MEGVLSVRRPPAAAVTVFVRPAAAPVQVVAEPNQATGPREPGSSTQTSVLLVDRLLVSIAGYRATAWPPYARRVHPPDVLRFGLTGAGIHVSEAYLQVTDTAAHKKIEGFYMCHSLKHM